MQPPTSIPPKKLQIRTYDCKLSARKVKMALLKLVETSPAFNESWINGEYDIGSRIGGLKQYGDIIVRHSTLQRGKHESLVTTVVVNEELLAPLAVGDPVGSVPPFLAALAAAEAAKAGCPVSRALSAVPITLTVE